jgi:hypothetical protein
MILETQTSKNHIIVPSNVFSDSHYRNSEPHYTGYRLLTHDLEIDDDDDDDVYY